ncbi:SMP-30/gluconolactonase/LRE family protein [Edaphobacter bradus]|uniref:SMP-30/gluconolactonase/LRE family protein n=1 Tax=Edaphobacter bradus TaxID=2259016 RepID=UPI0021DF492D|nr:SMP-30/gluconolactonase/LRE family protein [Edaphobacter bradus]
MEFFPQPVAPIVSCHRMAVFAEGLDHPEGLAFDQEGVLWAGGEAGQIYRISKEGKAEEVANVGGFCLGITLSPAQDIFVCNLGVHALQRIDRRGRVLQTIEQVGGRRLQTPNFSVFDADGNLYFSDSGEWNAGNGCVYRLRRSGVVEFFAGPFAFPNGMALSAMGDALFIVESQRHSVTRLPIRSDGAAGDPEVYASGLARVPDGVVLDAAQNLYVTCYATDCIYRVRTDRTVELFAYDPEGTMLARPTNAVFGGPSRTDLFVANLGRWHITCIPTDTPGQLLATQIAE